MNSTMVGANLTRTSFRGVAVQYSDFSTSDPLLANTDVHSLLTANRLRTSIATANMLKQDLPRPDARKHYPATISDGTTHPRRWRYDDFNPVAFRGSHSATASSTTSPLAFTWGMPGAYGRQGNALAIMWQSTRHPTT